MIVIFWRAVDRQALSLLPAFPLWFIAIRIFQVQWLVGLSNPFVGLYTYCSAPISYRDAYF